MEDFYMSTIEACVTIPAGLAPNVFGQFDKHIKKIERTLSVTMIMRGDSLKVIGEQVQVEKATQVLEQLVGMAERGNVLTEQNVDYALSLSFHDKVEQLAQLDEETVCHTVQGKPIKAKTLGQRQYLDMSKVDPYLRPLYDALYEIMGAETFLKNMEKGLIEVAPLAYMRGRTLDNSYIILDEAQNTTPAQMKMFLTRIGFGSKAIITGDLSQKDLAPNAPSGLEEALKVLHRIDEIGICRLTSQDVVRHPLVQKIVSAYESYEAVESRRNERKSKKTTGKGLS